MPLRIVDLVNMPELHTRFLSGQQGEGRLVFWAHVCELPNPVEWLGEGDLLMTTGLGIPEDGAAQQAYVEALAQAGLAGMMIGENMQAPSDLSALNAAADRLGFPVLLTRYSVPFASVTRSIVDANRQEEFERRHAIVQVCVSARLAIEGLDLEALLLRLERDTKAYLTLLDFKTLKPWLPRQVALPQDVQQILQQRRQDFASLEPNVRRYALKEGNAFCITVPSHRPCILLARHAGQNLLDYSLLHTISVVLGIAIERLHVENERRLRVGAELLEDLLYCRLSPYQAAKRLEPFHLNLASASLAVAYPSDQEWRLLPEWLEMPVLLRTQGHELMMLLPLESSMQVPSLLKGKLGVSNPIGHFERLQEALREARLAFTHAASSDQSRVVYAEIANRLPWLPQNLDEATQTFYRVLGKVADYDQESGSALLYTLKVFLEQNRSWQTTAKHLHIHKTTLTYRIRRIESMTGRSLDNTGDVTVLWLALQAGEVLGLRLLEGRRQGDL